ncbi:pyruvate dehydrogenase E1 component [Loa loa]|uniref:pyruvate dehydrogenase (acetyl-transferring) n=2 Tax=Loa loa TaxID=7209 RepID=A0A1S0U332_LOALO|nr:pyruvate dehydrogenase E1 component [Loa loa]EFO24482.2 pyruvate dehydrogenase E1 component [Loa loa]
MFIALSIAKAFSTLRHQSFIVQSIRHVSEASFQTQPFKLHRLNSGPSTNVTVNKSDALKMYRQMQVIRKMEQASELLYKERKIRGFCHLYAGQEACAVGLYAAKDPDDAIITSYRCHGFVYLVRNSIKEVLSELLGRSHGNVNGKGGSMHMYGKNFYGGNGIVGAQQPIGAGIAFTMKYKRKPNLCFTLYGDGAANQGQLSEAANLCALWRLPCVFICENNGYGLGTPISRSSASTDYYARGDYIPGIWVDAMDVLAVRESIKFARKYCTTDGNRPLFIEFATYRFYGHSMSDPGTSYRSREEVQNVRKTCDPISLLKNKILASNLATKDEVKLIEKQVKDEVNEAVKFARDDPVISMDALITDIYHNTPPIIVRGRTMDDIKVQPYTRTSDII